MIKMVLIATRGILTGFKTYESLREYSMNIQNNVSEQAIFKKKTSHLRELCCLSAFILANKRVKRHAKIRWRKVSGYLDRKILGNIVSHSEVPRPWQEWMLNHVLLRSCLEIPALIFPFSKFSYSSTPSSTLFIAMGLGDAHLLIRQLALP